MTADLLPSEVAENFGVPRETLDKLEAYALLLSRWNEKINLVGTATLAAFWRRHIADSLQLFPLAPEGAENWLDIGSGAGFPALPIAALAVTRAPELRMTVVESDTRKAAFLREAKRELGLGVRIVEGRAETLIPRHYDVISARALAPLPKLCTLAYGMIPVDCRPVFLFPKGKTLDSELTAAAIDWHIRFERIASRTDPEATVLRILELEPKQ